MYELLVYQDITLCDIVTQYKDYGYFADNSNIKVQLNGKEESNLVKKICEVSLVEG